ncbi:MAG TPA: hypothetical protein VN039_11670 [Nitrospira sp.]|nr:hypothetical protein [Nitrospira sp.]
MQQEKERLCKEWGESMLKRYPPESFKDWRPELDLEQARKTARQLGAVIESEPPR